MTVYYQNLKRMYQLDAVSAAVECCSVFSSLPRGTSLKYAWPSSSTAKPSTIIYYEVLCLCVNSVLHAYYWCMCLYRVLAEGTPNPTRLHSTNVVGLMSDLVRVGFVVDEVALRLVFLRALRFSPVSVIPLKLQTHLLPTP
jgi:hypothetical protein